MPKWKTLRSEHKHLAIYLSQFKRFHWFKEIWPRPPMPIHTGLRGRSEHCDQFPFLEIGRVLPRKKTNSHRWVRNIWWLGPLWAKLWVAVEGGPLMAGRARADLLYHPPKIKKEKTTTTIHCGLLWRCHFSCGSGIFWGARVKAVEALHLVSLSSTSATFCANRDAGDARNDVFYILCFVGLEWGYSFAYFSSNRRLLCPTIGKPSSNDVNGFHLFFGTLYRQPSHNKNIYTPYRLCITYIHLSTTPPRHMFDQVGRSFPYWETPDTHSHTHINTDLLSCVKHLSNNRLLSTSSSFIFFALAHPH